MQKFSAKTNTLTTHTIFPANVPELEIEFWTFCSKTYCRSILVSEQNQFNIKVFYFHVLSIFPSWDDYNPREVSSQDTAGGLLRLPTVRKVSDGDLALTCLPSGDAVKPSEHSTPPGSLLLCLLPVSPLCSGPGNTLDRMGVKEPQADGDQQQRGALGLLNLSSQEVRLGCYSLS